MVKIENGHLILNFGPQHPAAHGVLRLILELNGEYITYADPHIGLLHRGTEKLIETKTILQALPYFDRLDYVSMISQEHTFSLAIEELLQLNISTAIQLKRIILLEITRILNHLLAIGCHALDIGALTPFLWFFEEREKLMEFYERLSGTRMHTFSLLPKNNFYYLPKQIFHDIQIFSETLLARIREVEELLTNNRIWNARLENIGILPFNLALQYGCSGVLLRSAGIPWDLRKFIPYDKYNQFNFKVPTGTRGDCYDRYLIRLSEMIESIKIIQHAIILLETSKTMITIKPLFCSMEWLIDHFKKTTEPFIIPNKQIYMATEAPKGEFGVCLTGVNKSQIYRCKIKAPGLNHLQLLPHICTNHFLADLVTIIGSIDIVFGEIDR